MDQLQKLVSGRLKSQAVGPHPDPDLLTAFVENALAASGRAQLLEHLGTCSECRWILYLATQECADVQPVLTLRPQWRSQTIRWGTLVASVVIIASVLLTNRGVFRTSSEKSGGPARMSRARISQEQGSPGGDETSLKQMVKEKTPPGIAQMQSPQNSWKDQAQSFPKGVPEAKHMTAKPQANLQFDRSGQVRLLPPPNPVQNRPTSSGDTVEITAASPSAEPNENASPAEAKDEGKEKAVSPQSHRNHALAADSLQSGSVLSEAVSPHSQWSLTQEGEIQRSFDSGKSWQRISVFPGVVFRVVTSIDAHVWAGGNAGALYHSSDSGRTWAKIEPSANGAKLVEDIIRIQFSDSRTGTLTTIDGRAWTTSDGGQNWHLQ